MKDNRYAFAWSRLLWPGAHARCHRAVRGVSEPAPGIATFSPLGQVLLLLGETRESFIRNIPVGPNRKFYRGDCYPVDLPDCYDDIDRRLGDIIMHTSRTSGSGGRVQSFSSHAHVALQFARSRGGRLYQVDASEGLFMSAGAILWMHADHLVRKGVVRVGTVRAAVENYYNCNESEFFWLGKR